jgi:hypothetical protein
MSFWDRSSCSSSSSYRINAAALLFCLCFLWNPTKERGHCLWFVDAAPKRRLEGNVNSRNIVVYNKAAAKIDIFWIHPVTNELAPSNTNGDGIVYGAYSGVNSYVGHQFEVQEIPDPTTHKCKYQHCRKAHFNCSQFENQGALVGSLGWVLTKYYAIYT